METQTILIIAIVAAISLAIGFFLSRKRGAGTDAASTSGFLLLQQQLAELARVVDDRIGESSRFVNESVKHQLGESQKLIREVTRELTEVKETGRQIVGFADQLQSLQEMLKNPKQRGVLGEYYLETLLKNVLPPGSFQMQYPFPDGTIVDAAVFVQDKIIPIDSKFSLENYNRLIEATTPTERERLEKVFVGDLKNRITETSKYIQPHQGTVEFAFMFIPHEAIYYDLLINKVGSLQEDSENLIQRAAGKYKVIIVSPTSFLAYLQTVLQGLKALQIEQTAKDIIKRIEELGMHLKTYEQAHSKMGNALATTVNHYNATQKEFKKIDKDVVRITGQAIGFEPTSVEKPLLEE